MVGHLHASEKRSAFCGEDVGQYLGSIPEWVMCGPLLQLLQTVQIRPLVFGMDLQGGLCPVIGTCEQEMRSNTEQPILQGPENQATEATVPWRHQS